MNLLKRVIYLSVLIILISCNEETDENQEIIQISNNIQTQTNGETEHSISSNKTEIATKKDLFFAKDTAIVRVFDIKKGDDIFACIAGDGDIEKTIPDEYFKVNNNYIFVGYVDCVNTDTFSYIEYGVLDNWFEQTHEKEPNFQSLNIENIKTNTGVSLGMSIKDVLTLKGTNYYSNQEIDNQEVEIIFFDEKEMYSEILIFKDEKLYNHRFGFTTY